jgi:hypothetical protein
VEGAIPAQMLIHAHWFCYTTPYLWILLLCHSKGLIVAFAIFFAVGGNIDPVALSLEETHYGIRQSVPALLLEGNDVMKYFGSSPSSEPLVAKMTP